MIDQEVYKNILDMIADTVEAQLPDEVAYVLITAVKDNARGGTEFATCTNVEPVDVAFILSCVQKDMALAMMPDPASQSDLRGPPDGNIA